MENGEAGQRRHTLEPMNVVNPDIRTGDFIGAVYAKKEPRYGHHIARGVGPKCRIGERAMIKKGDVVRAAILNVEEEEDFVVQVI